MLIRSHITPRPPKTVRNVEIHGTNYAFRPLAGQNAFVCEVSDQAHIDCLLASGHFSPFDVVPGLTRSKPAEVTATFNADPAPPAPAVPGPLPDSIHLEDYPKAIRDEAGRLIDQTVDQMTKAAHKVTSPLVIPAALLLEQRKPKPRVVAVKLLSELIGHMTAGGLNLASDA